MNKAGSLFALVSAIASAFAFTYVLWLVNPDYTPKIVSDFLYRNVGERPYSAMAKTAEIPKLKPEPICPTINADWRKAQTIDGIDIASDAHCLVDNPYEIAAVVKGTNNISRDTLFETPFMPDTIVKGRDLDGDGDPDEIHINLEVTELNGHSPDAPIEAPGYAIAPGIKPGFWVFTPKVRGMATMNLETMEAALHLRAPTMPIRVEQGDVVKITLMNTHYLPHTIHLHGVDHPFRKANGEDNDGVPGVTAMPIMPGESFTYEVSPRQTGTMVFHCHVQPAIHIQMGLIGMFIVEENRPNNWVQTLNIGGGLVRHSSVAVSEKYDHEYDMQYKEIDKELANAIKGSNDPRVVSKKVHRDYNITQRKPEYFTLNGKSFPYTIRESIILIKEGEKVKMRVFNAGGIALYLHTHGHKVTTTHLDGILQPEVAQVTRDVVTIGAAQRADIVIEATNDGLHNYGPGLWLMHDHHEEGVTTSGIGPGGHISMIVYPDYLGESGIPKVAGDVSALFTKEYWQGKVPIFAGMDPRGLVTQPVLQDNNWVRTGLMALLPLLFAAFISSLLIYVRGGLRKA